MNKIDKRFLIAEPIIYVERELYKARRSTHINRTLFYLFNIFSMITTFVILVLTTLVISKILTTSIPEWYFYATTVVTAIVTLVTSLINFFYVKDKYDKNKELSQFIEGEIIKYSVNSEEYSKTKDKELLIFEKVMIKKGLVLEDGSNA